LRNRNAQGFSGSPFRERARSKSWMGRFGDLNLVRPSLRAVSAQIHGSAPFSESFLPHHPWRTGRVGRIGIPDSSQEGCHGSAGPECIRGTYRPRSTFPSSMLEENPLGREAREGADGRLSPTCCEGVACSSTEDGPSRLTRGFGAGISSSKKNLNALEKKLSLGLTRRRGCLKVRSSKSQERRAPTRGTPASLPRKGGLGCRQLDTS